MIRLNIKFILRILTIICIIFTVIFIWSNSLENASESSDTSGVIVDFLKPIFDPNNSVDYDLFTHIVRKAAHFSEFALLGSEIVILFMLCKKSDEFHFGLIASSVCLGFSVAVSDELIQLTSEGRACEFTDMMIDLCGLISGVLFIVVLRFLIIKINTKEKA